jgi:hypothetical protein
MKTSQHESATTYSYKTIIHSPCEGRDGQRPSRVKNNELLRGTIIFKVIIMRMKNAHSSPLGKNN